MPWKADRTRAPQVARKHGVFEQTPNTRLKRLGELAAGKHRNG